MITDSKHNRETTRAVYLWAISKLQTNSDNVSHHYTVNINTIEILIKSNNNSTIDIYINE